MVLDDFLARGHRDDAYRFEDQPRPVLKASTVLVGTLVRGGGQELGKKIA